ncbi:MAG: peptidase, partial [Lachnospiraceae bacterium]|nr:peptidase [Lachnospiraceae bacterium]
MRLPPTSRTRRTAFNKIKHIREEREFQVSIRIVTLQILFASLLMVLLYRLWDLQIVNGQKYVEDYELKVTRTIRDKNTRGVIYDCNGALLAYNELTYSITIIDDGVYASDRQRQLTLNSMIYRVVKKLEENEELLNNELKIAVEGDHYEYTASGTALARFKADIFGRADPADLSPEQQRMEADALIAHLSSNDKFALYGEGKKDYTDEELRAYGLPGTYTAEEVLAILGIRYMLSLNDYKKYVPIVLARDVSERTAAYIQENSAALTGIVISEDGKRVYAGGEAFSHILGYTGKISSEELEQYANLDKKYTADAVVGKAGIEQYLEQQLQGTDGEREITVNNRGKIIGEDRVIQETVSGRDVYLTIDRDLQIVIYRVLEQELAGILSSNLINAKSFDKSRISDTSRIRIPIYEVYLALVDNRVIRVEDFARPGATALEQRMADALAAKRADVQGKLRTALLGTEDFGRLSEELQEYLAYVVRKTGILREDAVDTKDTVYQKWKDGSGVSVRELLTHAIERDWIETGFIEAQAGYFTTEEMYALLVDAVWKKLDDDAAFEIILFKRLILEDRVTGKEVGQLLYDQQVLSDMDAEYEK